MNVFYFHLVSCDNDKCMTLITKFLLGRSRNFDFHFVIIFWNINTSHTVFVIFDIPKVPTDNILSYKTQYILYKTGILIFTFIWLYGCIQLTAYAHEQRALYRVAVSSDVAGYYIILIIIWPLIKYTMIND